MLTITTNSFENDVLHADMPVLVDFWAQWCPYCRRIAPAFDKVGEQYADTLIAGKINYDEEPQVFACKVAQKVSDDAAMVRTGGGTDRQKALDVQKQHRRRRFGHDAHVGDTVWRAGEGRGVRLSRRGAGENVAVAPDILLHDERAAGEHHADLLDRVAGMKEKHVLGELLGLRRKAGEHRDKFVLRDAGKERRGGENGKKFFHEKSPFVENSTDLLLLV